jgi:hypothetical protein
MYLPTPFSGHLPDVRRFQFPFYLAPLGSWLFFGFWGCFFVPCLKSFSFSLGAPRWEHKSPPWCLMGCAAAATDLPAAAAKQVYTLY